MKPSLDRVGPSAAPWPALGPAERRPALEFAARWALGTLFRTLSVQEAGLHHLENLRETDTPAIFVLWHGRLLPLIHAHRHRNTVVLVSQHRDGEYLARLLHHFGFETVRGSSTRGGVGGLKGLIRAAHQGRNLAITPDGPRGPDRELKLGALTLARMTGLPLVPVGVGVTRSWRARSWDGFLVPKPFSTVRVAYGAPSFVPRDATRDQTRAVLESLESGMMDLSPQVGHTFEEARSP